MVSQSIDNNIHKEYLLYGVTGSRKNRGVFAIDTKGIGKREKSHDVSS